MRYRSGELDRLPKLKRRRWFCGVVGFACVLLALGDDAQAVHLRGQILRVGYTGSGSDRTSSPGDVYRVGRYAPVLVELTNDDGDQFDGVVEVRQHDADGDEVVASREISIRGTRRINLYVPGGPSRDDSYVGVGSQEGPAPFGVRVFDMENRLAKLFNDKGEPVIELTPPRPVVATTGDVPLILDVSQRPVNQIDRLKKRERSREFMLLRCLPKELPDHVSGLEMVDTVVWDGADPNLLDAVQNEAILEWVRRGGMLIVGVSRNWNLLSASRLGPFLPVRLSGTKTHDSSDVSRRGEVFKGIVSENYSETNEEKLSARPLTYCPVTRSDLLGDAVVVVPSSPQGQEQIWVVRRACGRGQIVLASAELQEMLTIDPGYVSLLRDNLLRLGPFVESKERMDRLDLQRDLFGLVAARTAFHAASGFYFTFAFAFVIAYIAVVTGASWGWLKRRNATRQAWVIFAGVAAAASGISLGAVQIVRAFGQGVHEVTIVDGRADSFEATASSYLGLKTASHVQLDLCVPFKWHDPSLSPEARGSLRAQPGELQSRSRSTFSVPLRYEAVGPLGELRDVPLRATLKQFNATWRGEMTGRIKASLRHQSSTDDRLDSGSWIENQLGTDLRNCYVFTRGSRNTAVLVYFIPTLASGERLDFVAICKDMEDRETQRRASPSIVAVRERMRLKMNDEQWQWFPPPLHNMLVGCLDELSLSKDRKLEDRAGEQILVSSPVVSYVPPLLLLTFYSELLGSNLMRDEASPFRSQGQDLEMSTQVQPGVALFVGFSEDPGPLRLCKRKPGSGPDAWKPIQPSESVVMYRVLVPVR